MATKNTTATKKNDSAIAVGIGAAALAAAAAGATYYFYGSKDAKQHRTAAATWGKGLKREVVKRVKTLKKLDAAAVAGAVDDVVALYENVRGVSAQDLKNAAKELKREWKRVKEEASGTAQKTARRVTSKAKSTAKKVSTAGKRKTQR